jgi:hypothetical protein
LLGSCHLGLLRLHGDDHIVVGSNVDNPVAKTSSSIRLLTNDLLGEVLTGKGVPNLSEVFFLHTIGINHFLEFVKTFEELSGVLHLLLGDFPGVVSSESAPSIDWYI